MALVGTLPPGLTLSVVLLSARPTPIMAWTSLRVPCATPWPILLIGGHRLVVLLLVVLLVVLRLHVHFWRGINRSDFIRCRLARRRAHIVEDERERYEVECPPGKLRKGVSGSHQVLDLGVRSIF